MKKKLFTMIGIAGLAISMNAQNYIVGSGGKVLTNDKGANVWADTMVGPIGDIYSIAMFDKDTILVAGTGGVQKTIDAGDTWVDVPGLQDSKKLSSIAYLTSNAVTVSGAYLNPGSKWSLQPFTNYANSGASHDRIGSSDLFNNAFDIEKSPIYGNGWIVGDFGASKITGTTYTNATIAQFNLRNEGFNSVYNTGSLVIIVGNGGAAYKSADNGATWENLNDGIGNDIPAATTKHLYQVSASKDGASIIIVGQSGYSVTSFDGGANWSATSFDIAPSQRLLDVKFASTDTIFIADENVDNSDRLYYYKSVDGGVSFIRDTIEKATNYPSLSLREIREFSFVDGFVGYMTASWRGNNEENGTFKTIDGGATWQVLVDGSNYPLPVRNRNPNALYAFDSSICLIGLGNTYLNDGHIYRTINGGANWTQTYSNNQNYTYDFYFTDENTGYCARGKGNIGVTTNKGANWTIKSIDGKTDWEIRDIHNGWIVGDDNKVYKTTDYNSWERVFVKSNTYGTLYDVTVLNDNVAVAVGNKGSIYRTTNGSTWSYISKIAFEGQSFRGVKFTHQDTGFVVGLGGIILKTHDGGANWTQLTSPVAVDLLSVDAYDSKIAVIVGANGTILRTTNGVDFVQINSGNTETLRKVKITDWTDAEIALPTVTITEPTTTSYCPGATMDVAFVVSGNDFEVGNELILQLSDSAGTFAMATNLDTLSATTSGSFTNVVVPVSADASAKYRVRIIASKPAVMSAVNTTDISVLALPSKPATPILAVAGQICQGTVSSDVVTTGATNATSYTWSVNAGSSSASGTAVTGTITWDAAYSGSAKVSVVANNSCGSGIASDDLLVPVTATPVAGFTWAESSKGVIDFTNTSTGAATYSWTFGDTKTSTQINPQNTYTSGGTFSVELTAKQGICENKFTGDVSSTVGVRGLSVVSETVYPNPSTDGLVKVRTSGVADITIYNVLGNEVLKSTSKGGVKLFRLASGIYIVKIANGQNIETVRVSVQ